MSDITQSESDLIYKLEDKPPMRQGLLGAITHLLAIFVPMVTPALIVGASLKLSTETTAYLVSMAMIASGVGTWLQVNRYGRVGSGLLSIQSVNFSFVTAMIAIGTSMRSDGIHEELIMSSLLGVSFVGAFLVVGSSFVLPYLRRVITPTVSGVVVLMIGLSLIKVGIIDFGGGLAAKNSGTFGDYQNIGLGLLVLLVVIGFNCMRSPLMRMCGIAVGLMVGYLVALCLGMVDFSVMRNLPLITIPQPFKYGFSFDFHQFLVVGIIYLLSVLEAVGSITATAIVSQQPVEGDEYQQRLKGGVLADGLVSVIASALGSLPLTTFAQNNGVIQMTGVASRYVGKIIAVLLVILGLFPVIGRFFTTFPAPVLGGAMTLMFSMIAIAGIRIIITNGLKRRETLIVATSLGLGLGVSYDPALFQALPASIYVLVENPICAGGLTAIILNLLIPLRREEPVIATDATVNELE
ncbi:MAG: purine permease [Yokenella regensburgei]|jgi:uracil-xanthine permease|uniref:Xanthine permease XanQ n=2 Tax=Enterobacteriaceae TaxID=543 RepID=A0AB38FX51_9ENTR|nr:nucleobase:cation symporter-2 family protein [Yokenella regensburgei]EHM51599.1 xanthine permease [Yokenella regensburgei ATCC 43003]KAF1370736.1 uracil-xanthine permease [Yokenella regensburgei]KFD25268.1 putative purine permease [Yokenella regensburgei ATCC 49455]MDQ4429484.1 nucleobase:cation symporter-2 family protein [Yokenella regensburgei]MDR2217162.1 purine permease [Yokenella regensburgei]